MFNALKMDKNMFLEDLSWKIFILKTVGKKYVFEPSWGDVS